MSKLDNEVIENLDLLMDMEIFSEEEDYTLIENMQEVEADNVSEDKPSLSSKKKG